MIHITIIITIFILVLTIKGSSAMKILRADGPVDQCYDLSDHSVKFITTAPDVELEVLDFGGSGDYLIMLTGLGDNAHVFDNFAYEFTDMFHVIAITRRGFGLSSKPATGYDEATRVKDIISIMDQLNIPKANFIGHSIAGGELGYLGANYQDRVIKLVYMDATDYGDQKSLKQPPSADYSDIEVSSFELFASAIVRNMGFREPNAAFCGIYEFDKDGKVTGVKSPAYVTEQIIESGSVAEYSKFTAPVLGLFETWTMDTRLPYYWNLDPGQKAEYDAAWKQLFEWRERAIERFKNEIKDSRVKFIDKSYHYIYINQEADVSRYVREFLK